MRMLKEKDITGKTFGKWKVIKRVEVPSHIKTKNNAFFLCKCKCGNKGTVRAGHLRSGGSKGCKKCAFKHLRKKKGECSFNGLFLRYTHNAKSRNLEFKLSKEEFREITKLVCHYCGTKPKNRHKGATAYGDYIYNGIDRKDNNKGYIKSNCLPCCNTCNQAKGIQTYKKFKAWISRIIRNNIKEI